MHALDSLAKKSSQMAPKARALVRATKTNIILGGLLASAASVTECGASVEVLAFDANDVDSFATEADEVVGASVTECGASVEVLAFDFVSALSRESAGTLTVQKTVRQPQSAILPPAFLQAACCFSSSGKRPRLQATHGNFNSCAGELGLDRL